MKIDVELIMGAAETLAQRHHDCMVKLTQETANEFEAAEKALRSLIVVLVAEVTELDARRKGPSPSERLHNLCEGIAADADGSEWSREEWERLDVEMLELKKKNATLSISRDEVVEVLRKAINALPRFSFLLNDAGGISRVAGRGGNWIEWQAAHEIFDPIVVDALVARCVAKR